MFLTISRSSRSDDVVIASAITAATAHRPARDEARVVAAEPVPDDAGQERDERRRSGAREHPPEDGSVGAEVLAAQCDGRGTVATQSSP